MPIEVNNAYRHILWHAFKSTECPVCCRHKQPMQCFCRGCYFALKCADPKMAAGLYACILDDEPFFENYATAKNWLQEHGMRQARPRSGELFA